MVWYNVLMNTTLIFRHPHPERLSIEKVFSVLSPFWKGKMNVKKVFLPFSTHGIFSVIRNLFYAAQLESDHFVITGDVHYLMLVLPPSKTILCIHDLVFLRQSKGIKRSVLKWLYLTMPVRRANGIITISEKSKMEIVSFSGCNPEKILVIPNPVSDIFFNGFVQKKCSLFPTILFPGTKPNKNLERTMEALQTLPCKLIVLGKLSISQNKMAEEYAIDVESVHGISEAELMGLYKKSDLVLFPTLYEGFGLPILEAFASGTPLITSNLKPMSQIAEDAAFLCDPFSVSSIRHAVERMIDDEKLYNGMMKRGWEIVQKYKATEISELYFNAIVQSHKAK